MAMNVEIAQVRISRELNAAETALNEALLRQSELLVSLLLARRDTSPNQFEGQDALMRLSRSQQSLISAGGDLARLHRRLLEIVVEKGGPASDCPDDWQAPMKNMETLAA